MSAEHSRAARDRRFLAWLPMLLIATAATIAARADELHWDGNGAAPPDPAGGSGTWTGADSNWWNGSARQPYDSGDSPHDAIFGVTGGTVNITAPVTARSLRFDVDGYVLSGSELTLAAAGEGSRTIEVVGPLDAAAIVAALAGDDGVIKTGEGVLILSGANTFGGLVVLGGVVSVAADAHLGDPFGAVVLDGGTLRVTGGASLSTSATRDFIIGDAGATFDIRNTSNTGLSLRGVLSGTGTLVKTGAGTLRLDATNNMFAGSVVIEGGTVRFNNNNVAGPKALRMSPITFAPTSGGATLSLGGSDNSPSELRTGEWLSAFPGAGSIVAATTVSDPAVGASGHDLLIFALADAEFSGSVANRATSNGGELGPKSGDGRLTIRGIATQTLSGNLDVNGTIRLFGWAGLTLSGNAALGGDQVSLNLHGGTLTLDNSSVNLSDRWRDSGSIESRGGGTVVFIGNAAGSNETMGHIQLGTAHTTPPNPRSGALRVEIVHLAGDTAATTLTFAHIQRDSGRATIDFSARDPLGTLDLGTPGGAPRILLTTAPTLSASGLFQSATGAGWATVNGSDFATYAPLAGVTAVETTPFSFAAAGDNALLTTTASISGASNTILASLKIAPSAGQSLEILGGGSLETPAILLAGGHDFRIRNAGGGTGGLVIDGPQYFYIQQAELSVSVPILGDGALVKSGAGTLVLEGSNAYAGPTTINEGALRAAPGVGLGSGVLELRGGVLEITGGGVFNRHLDYGAPSGPGTINWSTVHGLPNPALSGEDRGSGGFAAVGADVIVDLNGLGPSDILWEDPAFLMSGYALILGSRNADARVELVDHLGLGLSPTAYGAREIRVIDNPDSSADVARLSGVIFSDSAANFGMLVDLLKTGDGALELTGDNTYIGGTIIAEGTLRLGHANALGRPAPGAYVLLGNRGAADDAALLTSAPLTLARDVTIPAGGSGKATIGAAVEGLSHFAGAIAVGTSGSSADKTVELLAEAGTVALFSGGIHSVGGYEGSVALEKTGDGLAILVGVHTIAGTTSVLEGTLEIDGTLATGEVFVAEHATLAGGGQIAAKTVVIGGTLSPGGGIGTLTFEGNALLRDGIAGGGFGAAGGLPAGGVDPTLAPEPGVWAMLLAGVLGTAVRRWRRK